MTQTGLAFEALTDICITTNANYSRVNYEQLLKTQDTSDELNLWSKQFFTKTDRFLLFKKDTENNPIENIILLNENDPEPTGYIGIKWAYDNKSQRSLKKKYLAFKLGERSTIQKYIQDLSFFSKYPPSDYEPICDINGFHLAMKRVDNPCKVSSSHVEASNTQKVRPSTRPTPVFHPLSGVLIDYKCDNFNLNFGNYPTKTIEEIMDTYQYNFQLENSIISNC